MDDKGGEFAISKNPRAQTASRKKETKTKSRIGSKTQFKTANDSETDFGATLSFSVKRELCGQQSTIREWIYYNIVIGNSSF